MKLGQVEVPLLLFFGAWINISLSDSTALYIKHSVYFGDISLGQKWDYMPSNVVFSAIHDTKRHWNVIRNYIAIMEYTLRMNTLDFEQFL